MTDSSLRKAIEDLEREYGTPAVREFCLQRYYLTAFEPAGVVVENEEVEDGEYVPCFESLGEREIVEQALEMIHVDDPEFMAYAAERLESIARTYNENTYLDSISPKATDAREVRRQIHNTAIDLYARILDYADEQRDHVDPTFGIGWPRSLTTTDILLLLRELWRAAWFSGRFIAEPVKGGRKTLHAATYGYPKQALVTSCASLFQDSGRKPVTTANEGFHAFVLAVAGYATGELHEDSQFLTTIRELIPLIRNVDHWQQAASDYWNLGRRDEARQFDELVMNARRKIPGGGFIVTGG